MRALQDKGLTTFLYKAPESWQGQAIGPAVDVYAAGLVFWSILTGHHPFEGHAKRPDGEMALMRAHAFESPGDISALRRVLNRMLDLGKARSERVAT